MTDPNEVFAWVRAVGNVDLLRQLNQAVAARVADIQHASLGEAGQHLQQPHVQPTSEATPGPAAMPLTGPDPQANSGMNLQRQAQMNERTQKAQALSGRGPGYPAMAVSVGGESDQENQQSEKVLTQFARSVQERNRPSNGPGAPAAQQGGGGEGGGGGQQQQSQLSPQEREQVTRPPQESMNLPTGPGGTGTQQTMAGGAQAQPPNSPPAGGGQQAAPPQGGQQQGAKPQGGRPMPKPQPRQ